MIKLIYSTLFFLLFFTVSSFSQSIKGNIKDTEGNPIPYATVYIREIQQGTVANTKGDYEIHIPEGKYTVIYQSLGYSPEIRNITIAKSTITLNITLQIQYYQIPEVRITATGEDPAYGIMRRAIGLAPYYLSQASYYKADVYLKGILTINKIPKLLQKSMQVEARNSRGASAGTRTLKEGETYLMESFNEIEFTAPDRYVQRVISSQSTFPEQGDQISPMDFIEASFYQPVIAEMAISPLSPDAFSHYRFRYAGSSAQGDNIINKIEVIPKRKSQQLFEGTIFIIEDIWCLHSVDLVNENIAGKVRVQQLYIPVKEGIWMPVSHKFDMNISIIGVKADAGYGGSIRYRDVKVNTSLKKPPVSGVFSGRSAVTARADTAPSKTREQIDKILSKNELTNRDMAKLSNLLEQESKRSLPDSVRNSLEVKDRTTYIIEKDAGKKDSAFWAEIRPIPLSVNEIKSIRLAGETVAGLADSRQERDSSASAVSNKPKRMTFVKDIMAGRTWSDTTGMSFTFDGLLKLRNLSFNTVDGFVYGTGFRLRKMWDKTNSLNIFPEFRYAFSRESLMWRLNGQYRFDRMHQMQIYWRTGMTSTDMANAGSINGFLNSVSSLLIKRSYLKLYDTRYITLGHRRELSNGLYLDISAGYEERSPLENSTSFSFVKSTREYTPNIPTNPFLLPLMVPDYHIRDHRHGEAVLSLEWTPRQKYRLRNNVKIPAGSDYPTFVISFKEGINRYADAPEIGHYSKLMFEASKRRDAGAFGEFRWRFRTGGFIEKSNITFADFSHFNSQPLPVLINDYEDAFTLKDYYSLSTPGAYAEFHTKYTTPYLLLKLLPGLSNTLMHENLSISFLAREGDKAYTETGYSVSEILFLGEAGVYAGFNNFSFASAGLRIVLKFD